MENASADVVCGGVIRLLVVNDLQRLPPCDGKVDGAIRGNILFDDNCIDAGFYLGNFNDFGVVVILSRMSSRLSVWIVHI